MVLKKLALLWHRLRYNCPPIAITFIVSASIKSRSPMASWLLDAQRRAFIFIHYHALPCVRLHCSVDGFWRELVHNSIAIYIHSMRDIMLVWAASSINTKVHYCESFLKRHSSSLLKKSSPFTLCCPEVLFRNCNSFVYIHSTPSQLCCEAKQPQKQILKGETKILKISNNDKIDKKKRA